MSGARGRYLPASAVTVVVAILASFVAFLDGTIVNVALPALSRDLGGGVTTQQWVVDGYLLTLGSLILIAGSLSDQIGRVRALRIGLVLFGAASVACALAPTAEVLIVARLIQGCGGALLVPSSLSLITAAFSPDARGKAVGAWTAWTSVAFVIGPPLGGVLVDTIGWRWVFAVNVVPVVATLLTMHRFSDGILTGKVHVDVVGAVLIAVGLAGIVFGLIEQPSLGWMSPAVLASVGLGVVLVASFFWWQTRTADPLLPLSLFTSRNFLFGNLSTAGTYAGVGLAILIVTLFLQEVAGVSAAVAGVATLPSAVVSILFAQTFGRLSSVHGPRLFMTVGPLIAAAAFVWIATTPTEGPGMWWHVVPGMAVYGLGLAVTVAPLTATVLGSVPEERSGIASAFNNAVSRIAGLVTVAMVGSVGGATLSAGGFRNLAALVALCLVAGGAIAFFGIRNPSRTGGRPKDAAAFGDRPPSSLHPSIRAAVHSRR